MLKTCSQASKLIASWALNDSYKEKRIMTKFLSALFITLTLMITACGGKTPSPGQVANAIITCTETVCTTQPSSSECTKLEGDVVSCLASGGNVAVCLAGIPDLVSVGYADIVCIIADLAAPSSTPKLTASFTVQQNAAAWLKTQRIDVRK